MSLPDQLTLEFEGQDMLHLEPVDSQVQGSWVATVLVLPSPLASVSEEFGDRQCGFALPPPPSYCPSSVRYMCSAWLGKVARCHPGRTEPVPLH